MLQFAAIIFSRFLFSEDMGDYMLFLPWATGDVAHKPEKTDIFIGHRRYRLPPKICCCNLTCSANIFKPHKSSDPMLCQSVDPDSLLQSATALKDAAGPK